MTCYKVKATIEVEYYDMYSDKMESAFGEAKESTYEKRVYKKETL